MDLFKNICLPFYFLLHLVIGLPIAILVGIIGGIVDRTPYYLEMGISDWIEEWINPYRLM